MVTSNEKCYSGYVEIVSQNTKKNFNSNLKKTFCDKVTENGPLNTWNPVPRQKCLLYQSFGEKQLTETVLNEN